MQCDEMLRVLDTDCNGEISWAEFTGAFRLIDAKAPDRPIPPAADAIAVAGAAAAGAGGAHHEGHHHVAGSASASAGAGATMSGGKSSE